MECSKYIYASEKLFQAVDMLACGPGDVRSRLRHAWGGPLWVLTTEHLPEKFREDFLWVKDQLHKYNESWPGQLEELRKKERFDPMFKQNYAHLYPDPVTATLERITNKTGAKIASRICYLYFSLESLMRDLDKSSRSD